MIKFSLPLNPKLSEDDFFNFLKFSKANKDFIFDIYFTSRIAPFKQDAMGDVFALAEHSFITIENALYFQEETGIPISATFNNISIRPDQKNLDLFIKNFEPLYKKGVRSCTLPFTTWMLTGQIQKEYPNLFIKNTILNSVKEAREVAALAEAGFHYVNLDRVLMRDHDRLREIKKVKDKYGIKLSLLANEGCIGNCPIMSEHYAFNNTRSDGPQYFTDPISRVSCSHWNTEDTAIALKTAVFPPFREDWVEFEELGIDVFKMHGRESIPMFYETIELVDNFVKNKSLLYSGFEEYLTDSHLENKPINAWRKKIKTCKFDCWNCNFCDDLWRSKGNKNDAKVELVSSAILESVNSTYTNSIEGLTSQRIKKLINSLGKISTSYLEIGVLNGATFCSAIENNQLKSYAVDHWKENTQAANGSTNIVSSKKTFIDNVKRVAVPGTVKIFDCDFKNVDKSEIDYIDFLFYDADHSEETTKRAVEYFADKLVNNAILAFDDANWESVVRGVEQGLANSGLKIKFSRLITNEQESSEEWWNGIYILVIEKD